MGCPSGEGRGETILGTESIISIETSKAIQKDRSVGLAATLKEGNGIMNFLNVLRRPGYLALTAALGLGFLTLYTFFDLREGGRESNLTTTRLGTPGFYIDAFGAPFFYW